MDKRETRYLELPFAPSSVDKLTIVGDHAPATSFQLEIPFAQDGNGNIERLILGFDRDYEDTNVLLAGTVGCGKTSLLQTIIASAAMNYDLDELQIWIDSGQRYEYEGCKSISIVSGDELTDSHTSSVLNKLFEELERRMSILRAKNEPIMWYWSHEKEKKYEPLPRILFIADEPSGLHEKPNYGMELERIARYGRAVGINCILATQNLWHLSANVAKLFNIRMVMRCLDYQAFLRAVEQPYGLGQPIAVIEKAAISSQMFSQGEFYLARNGGEYEFFKRLTAIKLD